MSKRHLYGILMPFLLIFFITISPLSAQDQCGVVDSVQYPIDTNQFVLVQDYAIASPRHQGRYHTGEDWHYAGGQAPGRSLNQPVRAIADGLVVLSSGTAWGVDGGVVIIRHQLANGAYFFSQYGHIAQDDNVRLPSRLSCVQAGQIIALIGDARPAPHLHFEIRVFVPGSDANPGDNPGPGYTREHPFDLGYRQPMTYITNLQAQLADITEWQYVGRGVEAQPAPLLLNDNSLLHLDEGVLRRLTWDGRVLWRVEQTRTPIHLFGHQANSYIVTGDGGVHQLNLENGVYAQSWNLDFAPIGAPIQITDGWLYPSAGDELVAVSPDHRTIVWRKSGVPMFIDGVSTASLTGLNGVDNRLWTLSSAGDVLHRADLRAGVSLGRGVGGGLIAYTWSGLWNISESAEWSLLVADMPTGGDGRGMLVGEDGRLVVVQDDRLSIYSAIGEQQAQIRLPRALSGAVTIDRYDDVLFIMSSGGDILALREDGLICGELQIAPALQNPYHWHTMGSDGTLRLRIGNVTMGLDWSQLIRGC